MAAIDPVLLVPVPIGPPDEPEPPPAPKPEVRAVRAVVSSLLGSLRGGPHLPDSGLDWAVASLTRPPRDTSRDGDAPRGDAREGDEPESFLVATTSDAGWMPPGTVVPAGVRVLWNVPTAVAWSTVDDPVRQLIEFAKAEGHAIEAVATTHPSRAYDVPGSPWRIVGERHPGPVLPGGVNRFEAIASPGRVATIRSLAPEDADRQARALLRDLEGITIAPALAIGVADTRTEARRFLEAGREVPSSVLAGLHIDEEALDDALNLDRLSPRALSCDSPAPDDTDLRTRLVERALVAATLAAAYHDLESAVYAWTFARYLAS
ncbi:hypothetical protein [Tsukamurella paurometabola]|uniref:Uncharacterized protein n=1 Tax=Tsukamurella paurometabola TaxID=2061 RepID=A0ABS5NA04_TSUPA|nr:hypothetical protein [Tsukamurella paurometabola]MBS4101111.1 hypothetical protein [Tsukamurella paurometabola]